jgi:threonine dehydratase
MAQLFTRAELDDAVEIVGRTMAPTPLRQWPLLPEEAGASVWVKHENHAPTGAFKVRGGLVLMDGLGRRRQPPAGVVSATRGNHGQSLALAGARAGIAVTIVVPEGNSPEKNAAIRGFGATLVVHGRDFDEAREHCTALAARDGLEVVPPFHPELVRGVATYALELFLAAGELDTVYVPVGMGSGICGLITVRDLLRLPTRIIGVVAAGAPAYARSFAAGRVVNTERADTFVDGVACRAPDPVAVEVICKGAESVLEIPDADTADAMRLLHRTTRNVPEPAGAIALAGLLADRDRSRGARVAVVMTGGDNPAS